MNYFGGVHKTFYVYWQNLPFLLYALTNMANFGLTTCSNA